MNAQASGPSHDEIALNEYLIEVTGTSDDLGRAQFSVYWRDDYLPPDGVRGQCFFANLDEFIAERQRRGKTIRFRKPSTPGTKDAR